MPQNKKAHFICQITDNFIKVIRCTPKGALRSEFSAIEAEPIPSGIDDKKLADKLSQVLLKLGYSNNPIILSLPRSQITCRNLKVPSVSPREIERISNLQASHYLPYSAEELITSHMLINTDREGYSNIILVIAHRDIINRYMNIFKELKPSKISIIPSSSGLANLCHYSLPDEQGPVMIVDIDLESVEFAIVAKDKLLFSRSFKLNNYVDWEALFINEITKTRDSYIKEVSKETIRKIIFVGPKSIVSRCQEIMNKQADMPAEILAYSSRLKLSKLVADKLAGLENSFASLIGLGLKEITVTLNLLPRDLKEKENKSVRTKEYLRIIALLLGIILIWVVSVARNLQNKQLYLKKLQLETARISQEARPLEDIEKKLSLLINKSQNKSSSLDFLHELYSIIPEQISLTNLSYEENSKVILRGEALDLNSVFTFVSELDKSSVFKKFNIKMRYATQKRTQAGEVVGFEINCTKK